jgi:hypothetical protein
VSPPSAFAAPYAPPSPTFSPPPPQAGWHNAAMDSIGVLDVLEMMARRGASWGPDTTRSLASSLAAAVVGPLAVPERMFAYLHTQREG